MWRSYTSKRRDKTITRIALVRRLIALVSLTVLLYDQVYFNNGLYDIPKDRYLSIDLGNGNCKWTPPLCVQFPLEDIMFKMRNILGLTMTAFPLFIRYPPDIDENVTYFKTLIAGFPSGDKRLTFVQMEALTGLSARDEWDFAYLGHTNQPFIKANYVS